MQNPYNFTRPVSDPSMFFGRWWLVEKITGGLSSGSLSSFAVYGGRRSGKTSLMRMVERRLVDRLDAGASPVVVPLYIDLQFDPPTSTGSFFQRLLNRLLEWESGLTNIPLNSIPIIREMDPAPSFADAFRTIYNETKQIIGGFSLALLVDESEHLHRPEWARGLEDNLRALLSNVPGVSGHLGLMMTGGVDFYNDMVKKMEGSPLRNVLDEEIMMPPLSDSQMVELIEVKFGKTLSEKIEKGILEQAGGSPFLGQFLMKHICDLNPEPLTHEIVLDIASSFSEKRRDFNSWFDAIEEEGARTYDCLCKAKRPLTVLEVSKKTSLDQLTIKRSLDKLLFHNLIRHERQKYCFYGNMFHDWFIENVSFKKERYSATGEKDASRSKYEIHIQNGKGIVIGDKSDVEQDFQN